MAAEDVGRELVLSLTNLVSVARKIMPDGEGTCSQADQQSVNQALKTLYPSTRGSCPSARQTTDVAKPPPPAATITALSPSLQSLQGSSMSVVQAWSKHKTSKSFKRSLPSSSKGTFKKKAQDVITETLKDIFFIPNPDVKNVPRRLERQKYYEKKLVASAVKFHSSMSESDIRFQIITHFPQITLPFPDFDFLQVVGNCFVVPH